MTYRPRLEPEFSARMDGIPDEALDEIISVVADICTDPYDRMISAPRADGTPDERIAELGDNGFLEFRVEPGANLIHLITFVWTG